MEIKNPEKQDDCYGKRNRADLEEIAVNLVKILLEKDVPFEDIEHLTGKSIEEIKRIGGLTD